MKKTVETELFILIYSGSALHKKPSSASNLSQQFGQTDWHGWNEESINQL